MTRRLDRSSTVLERAKTVPFTETETETEIASSLSLRRSRPSREQVAKKTGAWVTWADNSEAYPEEAAIAARRVRDLRASPGLDHEEMCAALAEYARIPDLDGQPHHAIGFTEYVARTFIAHLRDRHLLPAQLAFRESAAPRPDRPLHRLDVSALLARLGETE